jgi:erythronate-4-phosphate dehydrogenase
LKLVVDENIAFPEEAFAQIGEVILCSGRKITNELLKDVDALIVRSITKVNENLLRNTKVKFVGTATIGTDHIDLNYLKEAGIAFADAQGCNANSVVEYVFTVLMKIVVERKLSLKEMSIGVIGVGNVGSKVVNFSEAIGLKVLKNDPPKERAGIGSGYVTLDEALAADIITCHVPLNKTGIDKTFHLLGDEKLKNLKEGTILFNTSRGPVVNNSALLDLIDKKDFTAVLDVWEGEPKINTELLKKVYAGSPHVAGYSYEGKVNGTKMIYDALCNFTGQEPDWKPNLPDVESNEITIPDEASIEERLHYIFNKIYNIDRDDEKMNKLIEMDEETGGKYFDELRKTYPLRREFNNYTIKINKDEIEMIELLKRFRFDVKVNN